MVAGLQAEDTSSVGCSSEALVNQAVFTAEAFVNDMIFREVSTTSVSASIVGGDEQKRRRGRERRMLPSPQGS